MEVAHRDHFSSLVGALVMCSHSFLVYRGGLSGEAVAYSSTHFSRKKKN